MLQRGDWECSRRGAGNSRKVKGGVLFCNGFFQLEGSMRGRQCRMLNQKSSNSVAVRSLKLMFSSGCFSGGEAG